MTKEPEESMFVRQVWCTRNAIQHLVTIPANQGIGNGDFVIIKKYVPKLKEGKCHCGKKFNEHTVNEIYAHGLMKKLMR